MMTNIPVGVVGHIRNGSEPHPYVLVEDDEDNTGGYLILTSTIPDFESKDGEGFDNWVLKDELEDFFQEKGWQIDWSADTLPDV